MAKPRKASRAANRLKAGDGRNGCVSFISNNEHVLKTFFQEQIIAREKVGEASFIGATCRMRRARFSETIDENMLHLACDLSLLS